MILPPDKRFDPDLHATIRSNSAHIRDYVWNYLHYDLRAGYPNGLRVRHRAENNGIMFWIDYTKPPVEAEFFLTYGAPLDPFMEEVKAVFVMMGATKEG